jgi:hypothetical protein
LKLAQRTKDGEVEKEKLVEEIKHLREEVAKR